MTLEEKKQTNEDARGYMSYEAGKIGQECGMHPTAFDVLMKLLLLSEDYVETEVKLQEMGAFV